MSVLDAPIQQVTLTRWPPSPMAQLSHALDAVAATTVEAAEQRVLDHHQAVEHRKALRTRRGGGGPPARCSACHRFKSTFNGPCGSCGYKPGRGYE